MPLAPIRIDRILLRPVDRADIDSLHALWTAPEVRRYLWDDIVIARQVVEEVVESHLATAGRLHLGFWALHVPPSTSPSTPLVGFCGFRMIEGGPEIELLYGLLEEHWEKGLATEACVAALGYLWWSTSYVQVYARTDPPNLKSVQVMLRLGMTHVSTTPSTVTYVLRRPRSHGPHGMWRKP